MKTPILVAAIFLPVVAGCSNPQDDKVVLDYQEGFACSSPGKVVYKPWGPHGLSKSCEGPNGKVIGSFFTAEDGHLVIRAKYDPEYKHRMWEWLDSDGKVVRRRQDEVSGAK